MADPSAVRFGIIGCGLMGREFATAVGRWSALLDHKAQPLITGLCDVNSDLFDWYQRHNPSINITTNNYHELLARDDIDAIYCAVPHNLHEQIYCDIIKAGKHLLGEKPFGIDKAANQKILNCIEAHPHVFVRCSSEFPYFPGAHRLHKDIQRNPWGKIIEVNVGFLHSSDMNTDKPINWKRMIESNGEYGCMGDLGMHALHIPLRVGWIPSRITSVLSNIVSERYDSNKKKVPCKTWDNATLLCEVPHQNDFFPMTVKTQRIAPGEMDTWYIEVLGTEYSARFSTKYPKTYQSMSYQNGAPQGWVHEDLGYDSVHPTVTGGIFEFGFTDAILQMWGSFVEELTHPDQCFPFGCITPEETRLQHCILDAALSSAKTQQSVTLNEKNKHQHSCT